MSVPFEELMQTFDLYCPQNSDSISKTSVPFVLRSCGMFCTHAEMEERIQEIPSGSVGRTAFEEFVRKALKPDDFCTEKDLAVAFNAFATRDEALLSNDEVLTMFTRLKDKISLDEAHGVLSGFDMSTESTADIANLAKHIMRPAKEYKLTVADILSEVAKT